MFDRGQIVFDVCGEGAACDDGGPSREEPGNLKFAITLAASATMRMAATMSTRARSMCSSLRGFSKIGEKRCCWIPAATLKITNGRAAAT